MDPYYTTEMVKSHGKSEGEEMFNLEDGYLNVYLITILALSY